VRKERKSRKPGSEQNPDLKETGKKEKKIRDCLGKGPKRGRENLLNKKKDSPAKEKKKEITQCAPSVASVDAY